MKADWRRGAQAVVLMMAWFLAALAQAERQPLDRVIAIVEDNVILQSELDTRVQTVVSRLTAQGTGLPPRSLLEERVLDQLITDAIQLQRAEQMGMRISDNELNETLRSIARRNNLTLEQFEQQLTAEGLTYAQARDQIREEMLISRVQQRSVGNRVRVTDREVANYLAAQASRPDSGTEYQLAHILVAVDDFSDTEAVARARAKAERLLSEIRNGRDFRAAAVAESDASNALEGGVMGWRPESQLPSLVENVVPKLALNQPSEVLQSGSGFHLITVLAKRGGDGEQLIQQHRVRHILVRPTETVTDIQAERRIRDLYRQLQAGADFAELAREHSDDPVSGSDGGNLGWVSRGQMVPAFEQAMLEADIDELKGPFRSQFGWHILQVQERRQKDISDQVKESEARQAIYRRKFDVELQAWLREIRDEAFVEVKTDANEGDNA
ncbi:MAG: peptidylprolyl isomerase [Marinobacter sp.]|uniref:peptidylprolyl isomerase n=1 Tax=Marinobacter sp. TaxID=50741 RepID=UPI00299EB453|nr:peptidylprolyl isomerase [Marinobacter sp.]MDX1756433.1 peptidylprolyl isomerase [Marinobacter sp.]